MLEVKRDTLLSNAIYLIAFFEGDELKMVEIKVDHAKCDGCGTCKDTCPVSVFEINDTKSHPVNVEACLVCRACEVQCPRGAIQVIE